MRLGTAYYQQRRYHRARGKKLSQNAIHVILSAVTQTREAKR